MAMRLGWRIRMVVSVIAISGRGRMIGGDGWYRKKDERRNWVD